MAIQDAHDAVFGAWLSEGIKLEKGGYYGSGESSVSLSCFLEAVVRVLNPTRDRFLWRYHPPRDGERQGRLDMYKWTGRNEYVALCEPGFISFGGGYVILLLLFLTPMLIRTGRDTMGFTSMRPSWTVLRRHVRRLGIRLYVRSHRTWARSGMEWSRPRRTYPLSVSGWRCGVSASSDGRGSVFFLVLVSFSLFCLLVTIVGLVSCDQDCMISFGMGFRVGFCTCAGRHDDWIVTDQLLNPLQKLTVDDRSPIF